MNGVGLEEAWNLTIGSRDVKIAVIDTGVDWNHPDLAFNIWNKCANSILDFFRRSSLY